MSGRVPLEPGSIVAGDGAASVSALSGNDPSRVRVIGNATLYLGDCRDFDLETFQADAVVTDPPYGLGDKWQGGAANTKARWKLNDGGANMGWDAVAPDFIPAIATVAPHAIIWGGHCFDLPAVRGWLLWDKIVREFSSGHAEMAWTTLDQPVRAFSYAHAQLASEGKFHPTQKPLPLMKWCLSFLPHAKLILDPFSGSGTTGVAAVQMGKRYVGIERDPAFFEASCKRIDDAQRQGSLFGEAA